MSDTTQANQNVRNTGHNERDSIVSAIGTRSLGQTLRDARLDKGLDLKDVAGSTRVRSQYLLALEESDYDALPENVYTRNFIRLYAQALDLDAAALLEQYNLERNNNPADSKPEPTKTTASPAAARLAPSAGNSAGNIVRRQEPAKRQSDGRSSADFGSILPTLLLVAVIAGLGIWAWQSQFFSSDNLANTVNETNPVAGTNPTANTTNSTATGATASATGAANTANGEGARFEPILPDDTTAAANATTNTTTANTTNSETNSIALLSIRTVPEGARVSIDNYEFPELSPIDNAPLSAGENRTLRVELEGYEVYETPIDLSFDRNVEVFLTPEGEAAEGTELTEAGAEGSDGEAAEDTANAASTTSTVSVEIVEAASWLEVYQGSERGVGATLLYRTAEPGETFEYETPVFLFAGNAGNVLVSVDGGDTEAIGSPGQVTGQAFGEEDADEN